MTISGTHPERGTRIVLELEGVDAAEAIYAGDAFTPGARFSVRLAIDVTTGAARADVLDEARSSGDVVSPSDAASAPAPPTTLATAQVAFLRQLGKQAWRLATQTPPEVGGGRWPHRIHRWRAPRE